MKRSISAVAVLVLAAVSMGACHRQAQPKGAATTKAAAKDSQQELKTLEDRYSYAYGADLGERFRVQGAKVNVAIMAEAMQTVLDGGEKRMSVGEIIKTIEVFQAVHQRDRDAAWEVAITKNKTEGEAFLKENAQKEGVVVTKSGLQYKVIAKGSGGYKPTAEDEVIVHYRGRLIDGTEFDNSYARDEPYSTAPKALIQGWTEALLLMSKGSKWELYVPANLAYGEAGSPPYVGPNAVLIFEVELLEVKKYTPPA